MFREYITRFNKENVVIINPNVETIINAFGNWVHYGSDLYKELTRYLCKSFEDIMAKPWAQIRWDESKVYRL